MEENNNNNYPTFNDGQQQEMTENLQSIDLNEPQPPQQQQQTNNNQQYDNYGNYGDDDQDAYNQQQNNINNNNGNIVIEEGVGQFPKLFNVINDHGLKKLQQESNDSQAHNQFNNFNITDIQILNYSQQKESSMSITETTYYHVQAQLNGEIVGVKRRYKQFEELQKYFAAKLEMYKLKGVIMPILPSKDNNVDAIKNSVMKVFKKEDELEESKFIKNRQLDLQAYLNYINNLIFFKYDPVFKDFICFQECIINVPQNISEEELQQQNFEQFQQEQEKQQQQPKGFVSMFSEAFQSVKEKTKAKIGALLTDLELSDNGKQIESIMKEVMNQYLNLNVQIIDRLNNSQQSQIRCIRQMVKSCKKIEEQYNEKKKQYAYLYNLHEEKQSGKEEVAVLMNKSLTNLTNFEIQFLLYLEPFFQDLKQNIVLSLQMIQENISNN